MHWHIKSAGFLHAIYSNPNLTRLCKPNHIPWGFSDFKPTLRGTRTAWTQTHRYRRVPHQAQSSAGLQCIDRVSIHCLSHALEKSHFSHGHTCKASIVALNRRSILGLIFTTLSRDLARFNISNCNVVANKTSLKCCE